MKDFATAGIAALLMAGFYALGSSPSHHYSKVDQASVYPVIRTDTVPKKDDTTRMPKDTTHRRDTLQK